VHSHTNAALVSGGGKAGNTLARYSIIAIGGSAGGLESVRTILNGLPPNFASPTLVVIHVHPKYISHAAEILRRHTKLKVKDAQEREPLQNGTV
jgi:two-component system chemotaxis response regulator CheB